MNEPFPSASVNDTHLTLQNGQALLIDVRTPAEFRNARASGAHNLPLDSLSADSLQTNFPGAASRQLFLICGSGKRSQLAAQKLSSQGLRNLVNVEGGTQAWIRAGLPVERSGNGAISIERQVRIAAGLLVMTGVSLGFFLHPGWLALAFFVGAGLTFAGLTDTCGMALLLARMPWNR